MGAASAAATAATAATLYKQLADRITQRSPRTQTTPPPFTEAFIPLDHITYKQSHWLVRGVAGGCPDGGRHHSELLSSSAALSLLEPATPCWGWSSNG
ncbi:unnamed protein product [Arctogadus glacialis]